MRTFFIGLYMLLFCMPISLMSQQSCGKQAKIYQIIRQIIEKKDNNIKADLDSLIALNLNNYEYKKALKYITDNRNLKNESQAYDGMLGRLNKKSQKRRKKKFDHLMMHGWRDGQQVNGKDKKIILAEGDSWFMYPVFLQDIVNYLLKEDHYAIFSLAYGGDWLSNILKEETYLDEYEKICPDVLLLSGGGNDIVDNYTLASFLKTPYQIDSYEEEESEKYLRALALKKLMCTHEHCTTEIGKKIIDSIFPTKSSHYQDELVNSFYNALIDSNVILNEDNIYDLIDISANQDGVKYLNQQFTTFLNITQLQYVIIIEQIKYASPDYFDALHIILQGYDYVIPSAKRGKYPLQRFMNSKRFMDNGHWLKKPMQLKGILDPEAQKNIMIDIIDQYYSILESVRQRYHNISLVDSRNAIDKNGWYNELHPYSKGFKRISKAYKIAIDSGESKIYKVIQLVPE